jgi:putative Ig domain-containing protein
LVRILTLFALGSAVIGASPSAYADAATSPPAATPAAEPHSNRPPKFVQGPEILPQLENDGFSPGHVVRVGRRVRIATAAEDADGDALTFRATGLPASAVLDAATGVIVWSPTQAELGKHEVLFEVSDGRATTQRTTVFVVRANGAPFADGERTIFFVAGRPQQRYGHPAYDELVARDRDGDDLTVVVKKQPPGTRVKAVGSTVGVAWEPDDGVSGDYELVVVVSDGEFTTTIERTIIGPSAFLAHDDAELFVGGAVDVTLAALSEDGRSGYSCRAGIPGECHASHHRFYAEFEVLASTRSGAPSLFTYGAGYSASFEWYPARRYLVPHYGVELGGLVRDELGHRVQIRPYLGVHLWADRHVWLNAALGYRVVPAALDELSGPTLTLRAILNPW